MRESVSNGKTFKLLRRVTIALRFRRHQMPSSACCSNCFTKYSILNPEEGCSNCAFSFCRKCLPHRAIIPKYADKPVTVCSRCFDKLNAQTLRNQQKDGTKITRITIGDPSHTHHSGVASTSSAKWWGDGLPPPSLRTTIGQPQPAPRVLHTKLNDGVAKAPEHRGSDDLELRWKRMREEDVPSKVLTLSEIEERLAALRGCDVELIRRPRCMFETSEKVSPSGNTAEELMKQAKDLAEIEERYDEDKEMERRFKRLKYEDNSQPGEAADGADMDQLTSGASNDPRLSTVSSATAFSEATAKELEEINRLMEEAEKRVKASEADDKHVQQEMKSVLAATRQKSLELEKVNREIGQFWNKQLNKVELSDSEEDNVDDEVVKKIILEAEQTAPDEPELPQGSATATPTTVQSPSSKKAGLFSKIFRR
ncbi:hypothetical protein V3C99_016182 [Haemonchus contortus]